MDGHYSVKQTAEILKISTKTVRNRIASGELKGVWEDRGKGMSQWWIPMEEVNVATQTLDVVPMTRQISFLEMQTAMQNAISLAVQEELAPLIEENKKLAETIEELKTMQKGGNNQILKLREELEAHNRRNDERIREATATKSFWKRLFG